MRSFVLIGRLDLKEFPSECQTVAASAHGMSKEGETLLLLVRQNIQRAV